MAAAVSYAQIYGQENAAIMGNENIPAATRTAYINQAKNRLNTGLNLVEQVYNVKLDWGQVASVAGVNAQAAGGGAPVSVGTPGGGAPVSVGGPYSLPGTGASYGVNAGGGFAGPNFSGLNRI